MKVTSPKVTDNRISPDWDVKWPDGDAIKPTDLGPTAKDGKGRSD